MDVMEKLVELLKEVVAIQECSFGDPRPTYETVASYLIAHGVTVQEWISVEDRLPEETGLYLVAVVNDHERRYSKTAWYHGRGNWFSNQKVTHWMPLPEPPKGD